jgi:hypothetical protein
VSCAPVLVAWVLAALALTGCGGMFGARGADVTVQLEAGDRAQVMRVRQEVLSGAATWGGVRVGERTGDVGTAALEFTLPGENLDIALGAVNQVDARVMSTEIDVDAEQLRRVVPPADEGARSPSPPEDVRLRIEVNEAAAAGPETFVRSMMALFTVIGIVASGRWLLGLMRPRSSAGRRPPRRIDRADLESDPPTQENPQVPPAW